MVPRQTFSFKDCVVPLLSYCRVGNSVRMCFLLMQLKEAIHKLSLRRDITSIWISEFSTLISICSENQPVPSFIVLSLHLLFSFLFLVWTSMLPCTSMMHFVYIISFSSNCFSGSCDVNLVSISFHKRVTIVFKSPRRLSSTSSLVYFVSFQRKCCRKKLPGIFFKIKRSFCYRPVGRFFFFAAGSAIQ